ncbi:MAG TPA: hypothetical protein VD906_09585 [Caulobacteraceae bacterium]|nr:hypothetical protein [Caulobacteraceae bacterium]
MRMLAASAALILLSSAAPAFAAPAHVSVTVGPELQAKAEKTYGVREVTRLTDSLREDVQRALARSGAYEDARVELVLVDAKPNRPTFKQMTDTPGLSMESFGVGGAAIEGRIVAADGSVTPVAYRWYESDIRQAYGNWIWHDAQWTFNRFASRLAKRDQLARR